MGQSPVQAAVPRGVRAKPCRNAEGDDFECAADRIAILLSVFDFSNHFLSNIGKNAADNVVVSDSFQLGPGHEKVIRYSNAADSGGVAEDLDPEGPQENLGQSARGHPGRGFAGAGALQDVAGICMIELERPGQIRVPGTWARDAALVAGIARNFPHGHDLLPVAPIAVLNHHRDRTAQGFSVADTGQESNLIAFNFHSAAAAVTALTPFEFMINEFEVDDQMSRETFDQSNEGLTVRFPSGSEAQHGLSIARNCLTLKESFL